MVAQPTARAVDPMADAAVTALAQLTDPRRLEILSNDAFPAQLGPALGWLDVARHRDVAPEAVIARAFQHNGLAGERARLTREALLRNLARADAWELFGHPDSALALAHGQPAEITIGLHSGHLARAAVVLPEGLPAQDRREFACLVLRADDEMPPAAPAPRAPARSLQSGEMLAYNVRSMPARTARRTAAEVAFEMTTIVYDDPLPSR